MEFYEQCNGLLGTLFDLSENEKADDEVEVSIHTPENKMDETVDRVIDVLEHLDECIQRAYVWLSKQGLCDEWFTKPYYSPQELARFFFHGCAGLPGSRQRARQPQTDRRRFCNDLLYGSHQAPSG